MAEASMTMTPAPRLPLPSETPPHLPPPGAAEREADPLALRCLGETAPGAPSPAAPGARARMLSRASAMHGVYVGACGRSQGAYLALMAEAAGRLSRGTRPLRAPEAAPEGDAALARWMRLEGDDLFIDTRGAPWLDDHRPDYGVAVVPMTGVIEIMGASAQTLAPGRRVVAVRDLAVRSWIVVGEAPLRVRRRMEARPGGAVAVTLSTWREAGRAALSRDEPIARAEVDLADAYPPPPAPPAPLAAPAPSPDPYETAALFHGPAFQLLRGLASGGEGATAAIDYGASPAPRGVLHPAALDAALHAGADKRWDAWCPGAEATGNCLPVTLRAARFHGPAPRGGEGRVEMRGRGLDGHPRFPVLHFSLLAEGRVWATLEVVLVAIPRGPLDAVPPAVRRAHLRDRIRCEGARVSTQSGGVTTLADEALALADWIPRTIEIAYGIGPCADLALRVAEMEHAAEAWGLHPSEVAVEGGVARSPSRPGASLRLASAREGRRVAVRTAE